MAKKGSRRKSKKIPKTEIAGDDSEAKRDKGVESKSKSHRSERKGRSKTRQKKMREEKDGVSREEGFNIMEHELVPEHRVLSVEEAKEILNKLEVSPDLLPLMKASDPVAKAIGAKPGDIVEIKRKSPTAGYFTSYRYVIEG